MSDWLIDMMSDKSFDDPVEAKMDSLDNVFKIKQTANLIGVPVDSVLNMSDSTLTAAADSALQKIQQAENDTIPSLPVEDSSDNMAYLNPDILTSRPGGWLGRSIREKMSIRGSEIAEGGEDRGFRIDPDAKAYTLPPTKGREYFERVLQQYDKELSKKSDVLLSPESYGDSRFGEKLMQLNTDLKIRDNLTQQLSEAYKTIPKTEEYRDMRNIYLSKIESNVPGRSISAGKEDFVLHSPFPDSQPFSPMANDPEPLMTLSRMVDPLKDPPNFQPIPEEIAELKGWGRNPFIEVSDSLNAISDFKAESLAADLPITMQDQPEWMFDPEFDQAPTE